MEGMPEVQGHVRVTFSKLSFSPKLNENVVYLGKVEGRDKYKLVPPQDKGKVQGFPLCTLGWVLLYKSKGLLHHRKFWAIHILLEILFLTKRKINTKTPKHFVTPKFWLNTKKNGA